MSASAKYAIQLVNRKLEAKPSSAELFFFHTAAVSILISLSCFQSPWPPSRN